MTKTCIKRVIISALLCLVLSLGMFTPFLLPVSAAGTTYSNVLDDLKKDENFNPADFPENPTDYSLQVITVAEGENGELFVYVYQPSNATKDLRASKINMSFQEPAEKDIKYSLYDLTWLNSNGVFDKYLVNGVNVSSEQYRYYTIASIYRTFDNSIGDVSEAGIDDLTNFKAYSVAKSWCFYHYNGVLKCESKSILSVKATIHSLGYTRYWDGFELLDGIKYCDAHFVAFSIDNFENVQWVFDADLSYNIRSYEFYGSGGYYSGYNYTSEPTPKEKTISDSEEGYNDPNIPFFTKKYIWNRIVTVETFIKETVEQTNKFISDEAKADLEQAQFVFRFLETERTEKKAISSNGYDTYSGVAVSEIALLRLHFLADNQEYNLGVVSDIVSDDGNPDFYVGIVENMQNNMEELTGALAIIMGIVVFVALYLIFKPLIDIFLGVIWWAIKGLLSLISWLLTAPFRILSWLFKK